MDVIPASAIPAASVRAADLFELTKPRITMLVLITTAVGYVVAWRGAFDPATFIAAMLGTALLSGGASALNQYVERDFDARMNRTRHRPLPSGRVQPADAAVFGLVLSGAGLLLLAAAGWLTLLLGAAALASYVLAYTPLKRVTSLCTVVGAVPGAIPPMMGWVASRGSLDAGAWALFAVLFLWQLPHFLAIGWMYREDYARGGFPMLPVTDPDGRSTGRQMVLYSAALVPVTLLAGSLASAGPLYLAGAVVLGGAFLGFSVAFARAKSTAAARSLFLVSILYLPAVLGLMVFNR